jgi:hypothetical protein
LGVFRGNTVFINKLTTAMNPLFVFSSCILLKARRRQRQFVNAKLAAAEIAGSYCTTIVTRPFNIILYTHPVINHPNSRIYIMNKIEPNKKYGRRQYSNVFSRNI